MTLFSTQALSLELAGERRFATLAALAIREVMASIGTLSIREVMASIGTLSFSPHRELF